MEFKEINAGEYLVSTGNEKDMVSYIEDMFSDIFDFNENILDAEQHNVFLDELVKRKIAEEFLKYKKDFLESDQSAKISIEGYGKDLLIGTLANNKVVYNLLSM